MLDKTTLKKNSYKCWVTSPARPTRTRRGSWGRGTWQKRLS